ncbi:DNA-directed RNA polymerase, mitochondrial [Frankliniella fusca]|uniref:DNA-directed RNA polymerase n=1 Tax=Frankliniella fusca TaxID=407009 RepID=A0AAE1HAA4_9NEOP|nr:DNA-directed RNA polymerase, mitochondrial [Frankliniella fusca]
MHRFIGLKKLHVGQVNLSNSANEIQYTRRRGHFRVHSTSIKPEQVVHVWKKKMYRLVVPGIANTSRTDVGSLPKSRRKMRITILDSKEVTGKEVDHRSFITSSPSSPAFQGSRISNVGVTIMLPPSASPKMLDAALLMNTPPPPPPAPSSEGSSTTQCAALSNAAAELMFSGLIRDKYLINDFSVHQSISSPSTVGKLNQVAPVPMNFDKSPEFNREETQNSHLIQAATGVKLKPHSLAEDTYEDTSAKQNPSLEKSSRQIAAEQKKTVRYSKIRSQKKMILRRTAYIDLCLSAGKLQNAIQYAKEGLKLFPHLPFRNTMLEPLFVNAVLEGKLVSVLYLITLARDMNCPLSIESYVKCFDLLSTLPRSDTNLSIIMNLYESMMKENVSIGDLVAHCKGRILLIEKVLKAIDMVYPETSASFLPNYDYSIDVMLPLNDVNQAKAPRYFSPASGLLTDQCPERLVDEQIKALTSNIFRVKNIACQLSETEKEKLLEAQKNIEMNWRETIAEGFKTSLKALRLDKASFQLPAYLECLPLESFVELIIQEVYKRLDDSERQSVGFTIAERALGKRVKDLYDMHVLNKYGVKSKTREAYINYCKWYANPENYPEGPSNPREIWETVIRSLNVDDSYVNSVCCDWNPDMILKIGKFMYSILLKDVKVDANTGSSEKSPHMVPALYVIFRKTTRGYQKQIKMHPAVHHIFPIKVQPFIAMNPEELPMLCPPKPWVSTSIGVYPFTCPALQRAPESREGEDLLKENLNSVTAQQLYPCLDSLNQLGSIPWTINKPVLDVITEVFNTGGCRELDIPAPPTAAVPQPPSPKDSPLSERIKISKERALIRQENAATYSLWCDTLYKLCIAHEFRDRVFWLPHNMDFRGRVYPVCPHLQHMSNDMARSVLVFAKGEKLGPDGLDWLKLHTINLIGKMNKDSLAARLAYANEVMPKILDSAERPLTGERWWIDSEYPWQTLAACKEIAAALASGDPENFISHYPVHQDGSCNGLQHYAALGRDSLGAQSVNLVDTDKPSDVYMCVANSVEQKRANDAANGNAIAQSLEGFVTRKVIKQTVMTTVYGVTVHGAQLQIRGQLKDIDYPKEKCTSASIYLTKLVFNSLGEMFTSSRNIQDWLTDCASAIVKSTNEPVRWITPLGLPVVQPYLKKATKTNVKEFNEHGTYPTRMPVIRKHRNAFSPNFIHSLDSCHMILTGLYCEQANVTFVSVHDCYWVHPKNAVAMSKICREQFVALHSKRILEDLSEFLLKTYTLDDSQEIDEVQEVENRWLNRLFSAVPPKGDFDLTEVLKSKYFFS